jgi:prophage antirepressor-like protein
MAAIKEEIVRMIKLHGNVYFHQEDVCRILLLLEKRCASLNAKAEFHEALRIFSCVCDENGACEEPTNGDE